MLDTKRSRQMLVLILMSPLIVALLALMALAPLYLLNPEWVLRNNIPDGLITVSVAIDLTVMVAGGSLQLCTSHPRSPTGLTVDGVTPDGTLPFCSSKKLLWNGSFLLRKCAYDFCADFVVLSLTSSSTVFSVIRRLATSR